MLMIKVLYDFIRLNISEKISFYRFVLQAFITHPIFNAPDVPIETSTAAVDALEAAYLNALNGDRVAIAIRNDCEATADTIFRDHAAFVERTAKSNETIILSSGFHATRQPTAPQKEQFYIIDGDNTGCVHLFSKPTPRAGAYIWQMYKGSIPLNEADWITIGHTTRADLEVSGLEATAIYYFRNCAITPDGKTDYCAPVKKIVI